MLGDHLVLLQRGLRPFDLAFVLAHELGHIFDHLELTDDLRSVFLASTPGCDSWWSNYSGSGGEAFATAFAVLSCNGPWLGSAWFPCNWESRDSAQILSTAREVIREACVAEASGAPPADPRC